MIANLYPLVRSIGSIFVLLTVINLSSHAQSKLNFGVNVGYSALLQNYRSNDLVMKTLEIKYDDEFQPNAIICKLKGFSPLSLGLVGQYPLNQKSYIESSINYRIRIFRLTYAWYDGYLPNGNPKLLENSTNYWDGSTSFFVSSLNVPIWYKREIKNWSTSKIRLSAGIGFSFYYSVLNAAKRRQIYRGSITYSDQFEQNKGLQFSTTYRFQSDPYYSSNAVLQGAASITVSKTRTNLSRWEFSVEFFDNFSGDRFKDYIELRYSTRNFDTSTDPITFTNESEIRIVPFYLQQGGINFSFTYFPKPFTVNYNQD